MTKKKKEKDKIIVSKKVLTIIKVLTLVVGLIIGYFLSSLFDGWKFYLSILIAISVGYIIFLKISPEIYEENKSEGNQ